MDKLWITSMKSGVLLAALAVLFGSVTDTMAANAKPAKKKPAASKSAKTAPKAKAAPAKPVAPPTPGVSVRDSLVPPDENGAEAPPEVTAPARAAKPAPVAPPPKPAPAPEIVPRPAPPPAPAPEIVLKPAPPPAPASPPRAAPGSLDFDLLGASTATAPPLIDSSVHTRRLMLQLHQGLGIAMLAATLGTVVFGQFNYSDRFQGGSSGKFETVHAVFAYTSFTMFVGTGALAIFAPSPLERNSIGLDRITLHRIGMYGAALGMIAQIVLGIVTTQHEGYSAQQGLAEAHLGVGYATAGLMALGVGSLVF